MGLLTWVEMKEKNIQKLGLNNINMNLDWEYEIRKYVRLDSALIEIIRDPMFL